MSEWRNAVRAELSRYRKQTGRSELELHDLYDFSLPRLKERFPENNNVEAKLRQQLQVLRDNDEIEFVDDEGIYRIQSLDGSDGAPRRSKLEPSGTDEILDNLNFEVGQRYDRMGLRDVYGGQRHREITTHPDYPAVFLFTGDAGEQYGSRGGFQPDGSFFYTGAGTEEGTDRGNAAVRDHQRNDEQLHLFENTDDPRVVTYVGEFECVDHHTLTVDDGDDNPREALRFVLEPVGSEEIETENPDRLDTDELYERAKQSSPTEPTTGTAASGRSYSRSEIVKRYALRDADGVCQGCGEDAPFVGTDGEPFLEVHHLYRRSDGGADDPDNVLALCPNCHRRVHYGEDGEKFNQRLIAERESS